MMAAASPSAVTEPLSNAASPAPRRDEVAVIIVNHNGGAMLERCLAALRRQRYRAFRVIVVDNASSDGSTAALEAEAEAEAQAQVPTTTHLQVQLLHAGANLGFAAANNLALRAAGDVDWIACLNPDAFADPDWLAQLMAAAHRGDFDFFGCHMRLADDPSRLDGTGDCYHVSGLAWRRDHRAIADQVQRPAAEIFAPCAAAALYRRADLEAVGGFDERYFCYFEDVDLAIRLRLLGKRCGYVPSAIVDHVSSGIVGQRSDFATYYGHRNMVWTFVKTLPAPLLWRYLPAHLLVNLLAIGACAARGQLRVVLRAKRDALRGLPAMIAARRQLQRQARIQWRSLRAPMARGLSALWKRP